MLCFILLAAIPETDTRDSTPTVVGVIVTLVIATVLTVVVVVTVVLILRRSIKKKYKELSTLRYLKELPLNKGHYKEQELMRDPSLPI